MKEDADVGIISYNFIDLLFLISYLFPVINLEGPQLELSRVVSKMKFETREDYEKYFARLEAFPKQVHLLGYQ